MTRLREEKGEKVVPLLAQFKKPLNPLETQHWYDEKMGLNVVLHNGRIIPAVLLPGYISTLKTKVASVVED